MFDTEKKYTILLRNDMILNDAQIVAWDLSWLKVNNQGSVQCIPISSIALVEEVE